MPLARALWIYEYLTRSVFSDSPIVGSSGSPSSLGSFREMVKEVASSHSRSPLYGSLNLGIAAFPTFAVLGFCHFRNHCRNTHNFETKTSFDSFNSFRFTRSELADPWSRMGRPMIRRPTPGGVFSRFSRRGFVDANSPGAFRLDQNRETRGHRYTPPPGVPRVQEGTKF